MAREHTVHRSTWAFARGSVNVCVITVITLFIPWEMVATTSAFNLFSMYYAFCTFLFETSTTQQICDLSSRDQSALLGQM
jgi:hypothetical protein